MMEAIRAILQEHVLRLSFDTTVEDVARQIMAVIQPTPNTTEPAPNTAPDDRYAVAVKRLQDEWARPGARYRAAHILEEFLKEVK